MKRILIAIVASVLVVFTSCKKDSNSNDSIIAQNVHGQVYNFCTGSGLANVTVYLKIHENNNISTIQTVSGTNGGFTFNLSIHSSDNYTYELYIPSVSGIGNVGFDGVDGYIIKSNINQNQMLEVVPRIQNMYLYFPANTALTINDTFTLVLQQNIFHKNVPNGVYQIVAGDSPTYPPPHNNFIGSIGSYPMGRWKVILDKTKNGVHIIKTDSFYVSWGATVTDTIPW